MPNENGPLVGMLLSGRYLIEKQLGRGGVGAVYLARDKQLRSKPVVIKVLLEETSSNPWFKKKFSQEVEALARIDHPGVVGVLDAGEMPDGKPYIVMQFVEGNDLRSVMMGQGMNLSRVAKILWQMCSALSAAHDKGIYHRDLKPENIMLQAPGEGEEYVKLIDFGIATVKGSEVGSSNSSTMVAGSITYMAPEQLAGRPAAESDIYALGVIVFEMVTGRTPFSPETVIDLYEMQKAGTRVKPRDLRPQLPEAAQDAILRALRFNPSDRFQRARDFADDFAAGLLITGERQPGQPTVSAGSPRPPYGSTEGATPAASPTRITNAKAKRAVLLYKRNAGPDEYVLNLLETVLLAQGYSVFVDRHLSIGVEWAREIEREVRTADAVIALLSAASVSSEMVAYEIQIAHEAAQRQNGKPRLFPIRINFVEPLPEQLAVLTMIQYALWKGPYDDERLIAEVLNSMRTESLPRVTPGTKKLEPAGGAVPLDSEFYIVRPTDDELRSCVERQDSIILIKGARQMGKTSLLARGLQQAREAGSQVVLTDFQTLNAVQLQSADTLLLTLAEMIADQLDLDVLPTQDWNPSRGPSMNFARYLRREVLGNRPAPLVWGLDEVDRLFACDFASEIFGLFRSWHNARSLDPAAPWKQLTLAMAYATEAHLFITDVNQSPFNVGTRIALGDFTYEQVAELNRRYGSPLKSPAEVARFYRLLSGQPYLVRRGLYELATNNTDLASFEALIDRDEGPFGDHLRRILVLLAQDAALCNVVRGVLQGQPCPDSETFYRLRSAGVMSGDSALDARPRCQLYATYLERHLL